jgi:septal ring factor EnvC (AmiA/AmiB activator)
MRLAIIITTAALIAIGLVATGTTVYVSKASRISTLESQRSDLKVQRRALHAENTGLEKKLKAANTQIASQNTRLTNYGKSVRDLNKRLGISEQQAAANYSNGYSNGSSTGYNTGRVAGLVQGSDSLACSDDADVYWLPACNY